jgi:hypothetical protein
MSSSYNAEYMEVANNFNNRDMFMIKEPMSANGDIRYGTAFNASPYGVHRLDPRYLNPQYVPRYNQQYAASVARISYKHKSVYGSERGQTNANMRQ